MNNPYSAPTADVAYIDGDDTYQPSMFAVSGRIGRLRYVAYSSLASIICMIVIGIVMAVSVAATSKGSEPSAAGVIVLFLCYIPMFAIGFIYARRRFNDTDNTGWLSLLYFVPFVGMLVWLYLVFCPGTTGSNKYGPAPGPNNTAALLGAAILPIVAILGILAAVAIPAYQDYTKRAHAAKMQQAQPQQSQEQSQ